MTRLDDCLGSKAARVLSDAKYLLVERRANVDVRAHVGRIVGIRVYASGRANTYGDIWRHVHNKRVEA